MRIATFNANSIRSRLPVILDWLDRQHPDVLCIQETKVTDDQFPSLPLIEKGYHVVFRGEKSYNGVAVLSREKPAAVHFGLDDGGPADETRFVHVTCGRLQVVNTYVPQGRALEHPMYPYKLEWFRRVRAYLERHSSPDALLLWTGDLNVAPAAMDIHNAAEQENHVCYHVDVRRAFADTVAWGLVDVFRKHHPEPGQYTFFDYRTHDAVKRRMGWRIDHMLATRPLALKSTDCFVDLEPRLQPKPSDHTFLVADFDL